MADQQRLSHQIWWAQYNYTQGRRLSDQVCEKTVKFDDLTYNEQWLVEEFDSRRSARALDDLKALRRTPYLGPASAVQNRADSTLKGLMTNA